MKPEEKAEIRIGAWLMENGIDVFINRSGVVQKSLCCNVFHVSGITKKPDMIFYDGDEYYVVEIKSGIGASKQTRDSRKIILYYENYLKGKTKYLINGKEIHPKYFLVASYYSPEGHLFRDEHLRDRIKNGVNFGKERNFDDARKKGIPITEYYKTFGFCRQIWDEWKHLKDKRFVVGVILSDKLNGLSGKPTLFIQEFNFQKNKWLPPHRFRRIGEDWYAQ